MRRSIDAKVSRSLLVLGLAACGSSASAPLPDALQARYDVTCAACHETGAADAPRRGDDADWGRRRPRGFDVMFARVREGTLAMPPRGLCYTCSDDELRALARYVSGVP